MSEDNFVFHFTYEFDINNRIRFFGTPGDANSNDFFYFFS